MVKGKDVSKLIAARDAISKNFPVEHVENTFWCPKDKDGDDKQPGFYLYAYGGCVLKLYLITPQNKKEDELHFSLFDNEYEKFFADKNGNATWTEESKNRFNNAKKLDGGSEERYKRLLKLVEEDWNIILSAFRARAYPQKDDDKQYLERARETVIAHKNNGSEKDGIKIIEMESRIRGITTGKKPDMIGVRKEGNETILSFIEYKCTTGTMEGNCRLIDHFRDMQKYYMRKGMFDYYESYDARIGSSVLGKVDDARRESLFILSHVGSGDTKEGMTPQKAIDGLKMVRDEYDGSSDQVRVVILKDEKDIIRQSDILSLDDAIRDLEQ